MKKGKKFSIKNLIGKSVLYSLLFLPVALPAQPDSTKKSQAPTAVKQSAVEPASISPSLAFTCVQKPGNVIDMSASLKTKIKGAPVKLPFLKVKFIQVNGTEEKELGYAITNGQGKAVFSVKDSLVPDAEGKLSFKAIFAGNKEMESADGEMAFKKAKLELTPVKEDSVYTVKIKLLDISAGQEAAIPQTEVGIFVKRSFMPMKIGSTTTDENGEASLEIPNSLPGDEAGNITLLAKLDENEVYGSLETSAVEKWGVPATATIKEQPRALWSPHPPIWMLITFIVLMTAVWGHFFVIVYQLWRLRKEDPETTTHVAV